MEHTAVGKRGGESEGRARRKSEKERVQQRSSEDKCKGRGVRERWGSDSKWGVNSDVYTETGRGSEHLNNKQLASSRFFVFFNS